MANNNTSGPNTTNTSVVPAGSQTVYTFPNTYTFPTNPIIYNPPWSAGGYNGTSSCSSVYFDPKHQYSILIIPENRMPYKVYSAGKLLTLGVFGSDAECSFCPKNKLIFSASCVCDTISIEYKKYIYHFKLISSSTFSPPKYKDGSRILESKLISQVYLR